VKVPVDEKLQTLYEDQVKLLMQIERLTRERDNERRIKEAEKKILVAEVEKGAELMEKLEEIHVAALGEWNEWFRARSADWVDEVSEILAKQALAALDPNAALEDDMSTERLAKVSATQPSRPFSGQCEHGTPLGQSCRECDAQGQEGGRVSEKPTAGHLWDALRYMWSDRLMNCCTLPCQDKECMEDYEQEGGCAGAEFGELLRAYIGEPRASQGNSDDGPGVNDDKTWQDLHYHDDGTPKRGKGKL